MGDLRPAWSPIWAQAAGGNSNTALVTFLGYTAAVFVVAWFSNRLLRKKSFLSEYFLGSRSLGVWAFALTFAATSASGGSFTGFPGKIYTHGWILALWIASYMVVPICTMGLLGKRINQVARKSGAITVPDVLRDRFDSVTFGALATVLIVFFMSFNLVAQFKAGSTILATLLGDVPAFRASVAGVGRWSATVAMLRGVEPDYLLCLGVFAVLVIAYTTYGGFHAVVWTDVMQGVVMVVGVLIMLPLALWQVGGLESATRQMSEMTPPLFGQARLDVDNAAPETLRIPAGSWLRFESNADAPLRLLRTRRTAQIKAGETVALVESADGSSTDVPVLEITTQAEIERVLADLASGKPIDGRLDLPVELNVAPGTMDPYAYAGKPGVYITGPGPGPNASEASGFLPLSVAISFFFMWAISGAGQPSNMVRLMAFNNVRTLKRAIFTVSVYYSMIYFPLVVIFCCARVLLPGMEYDPDSIMPRMAVLLTHAIRQPWLAGLLVAAPFAAIMSTVDSFLLMISSALVRDVYQRNINPHASEKTLRRMSYGVTLAVGLFAMVVAFHPPRFLQDIIVYVGSGLAACFLLPVALGLYWPRINASGAIGGMLGGFLMHLGLYVYGYWEYQHFSPYRLLSVDPVVWGLFASLIMTIAVTLVTPPPPDHLVRKYFLSAD